MNKGQSAFTIVELVVVLLIVGILSAVATSRIRDVYNSANENSLHQSLRTVRDALDSFYAENGRFPDNSTGPFGMTAFVQSKLREGQLPACPVGNGLPRTVEIVDNGLPIAGTGNTNTTGKPMWKYDSTTGEFVVNYHYPSTSGLSFDRF